MLQSLPPINNKINVYTFIIKQINKNIAFKQLLPNNHLYWRVYLLIETCTYYISIAEKLYEYVSV